MEHLIRPSGSPPVNGYSHAVVFSGAMVAVSGQVPLDGDGNLVGKRDAEAQVRQVYANLAGALEAAGSGLEHVVKLTVYLTDLGDLAVFRKVRDEHQDAEHPPACSLVRVAGLVHPDFRVEIDALAVVPGAVASADAGAEPRAGSH
ncbi:RidA family protein [Streptomyces mangrovisoli]|uniref:Enamine deaminase RidA n=1 Tax=Streptomyces mangrovisoli TaxID=1428628 RepID=A0A1J4NPF2_9ACTN|nr:RidA family protein [Streptomyces mangrovisoli]OIJ64297.1 enamine deaminase RidA [Streptomyces mangrovisoli]